MPRISVFSGAIFGVFGAWRRCEWWQGLCPENKFLIILCAHVHATPGWKAITWKTRKEALFHPLSSVASGVVVTQQVLVSWAQFPVCSVSGPSPPCWGACWLLSDVSVKPKWSLPSQYVSWQLKLDGCTSALLENVKCLLYCLVFLWNVVSLGLVD